MAEFFLALFIFLGVMAVTVLVFGGWIIVSVLRGVGILLGLRSRRAQPPLTPLGHRSPYQAPIPAQSWAASGYVQCAIPGCRHVNPAGAKFCRHCGHAFPPPQAAVARRVAMF
jgi:hypothetical protein